MKCEVDMHFYFQPTVLFFLVIHAGSVLCLPRPRPFPSGGAWEGPPGASVPLVRPERRAVGRRCRPRFRCCFGLPVLPWPRGGIFFFITPASLRFVCLVSRRFSSGVMETNAGEGPRRWWWWLRLRLRDPDRPVRGLGGEWIFLSRSILL